MKKLLYAFYCVFLLIDSPSQRERKFFADYQYTSWKRTFKKYSHLNDINNLISSYCSLSSYPSRKAYRQAYQEIIHFKHCTQEVSLCWSEFCKRFEDIQKAYSSRNYCKVIYLVEYKPIIFHSHFFSSSNFFEELNKHCVEFQSSKNRLAKFKGDLQLVDWQTIWLREEISKTRSLLKTRTINFRLPLSLFLRTFIFEYIQKRIDAKEAVLSEVSALYRKRQFAQAGERMYQYREDLDWTNAIEVRQINVVAKNKCCCREPVIPLMLDCPRCGKPYK